LAGIDDGLKMLVGATEISWVAVPYFIAEK
jgi:hypothetical protein